jgi:hypothetical protein
MEPGKVTECLSLETMGTWAVYSIILGLIVLMVDFGRMMYLRWRMVTALYLLTLMPGGALLI